jgi:hypothetical protein
MFNCLTQSYFGEKLFQFLTHQQKIQSSSLYFDSNKLIYLINRNQVIYLENRAHALSGQVDLAQVDKQWLHDVLIPHVPFTVTRRTSIPADSPALWRHSRQACRGWSPAPAQLWLWISGQVVHIATEFVDQYLGEGLHAVGPPARERLGPLRQSQRTLGLARAAPAIK